MAPKSKKAKLEAVSDTAAGGDGQGETKGSTSGLWSRENTLLYLVHPSYKSKSEVYGFDFDSTLVEPEDGRKRKRGRGDWQWLFDSVLPKLKEAHSQGKALVIFSNQNGINYNNKWDASKEKMVTGMVSDVIDASGLPISAFLAAGDDNFRKPQSGMWEFFEKINKEAIDKEKSLYVGDAAGRPDGWQAGKKKDFSCSDRKFAKNVGLPFKTPEEFFLGEAEAKFEWGGVDTTKWQFEKTITKDGRTEFHKDKQEVIIFCGFPGSGKTTFATRFLISKGYSHINRDTLKTPKACYNRAKEELKKGKSIVVDNTFPKFHSDDKDGCNGREAYVDLAQEFKAGVRLFRFAANEELAKHLNMYREKVTDGAHKHVSRIGYNLYKKELIEPALSEGYSEILHINFVPDFSHLTRKDAEEMFYNSSF